MEHEGLQIEYKREYIDNFKYSVIAFANGDGGQILFGMNDDGSKSPMPCVIQSAPMFRSLQNVKALLSMVKMLFVSLFLAELHGRTIFLAKEFARKVSL